MNDCDNVDVREALPLLAHDLLPDGERLRVLLHLDSCDTCSGELVIIRNVIRSADIVVPPVDISVIAAAIPAYSLASASPGPAGAVFPNTPLPLAAHSRTAFPRALPWGPSVSSLRMAAAFLLGAAGISALAVRQVSHRTRGDVAVGKSAVVQPAGTAGVALIGTADVSDENLERLIRSMGEIKAQPPVEPEPVTPLALEGDAS